MKKNAFTLIELSIVLVIIGLIIGGSFKVLKTMRERAEVTRAQDDVKVAKEAIIGNTILNSNTLPDVAFFNQNLSPIKTNQHQLFYAPASDLLGIKVCSKNTTNLKVQQEGQLAIDNVAFVVASESSNHNMQTALISNSVKTYKYATKKDDNTSPVNIQENYDDIVDWVTLSELQSQVKCNEKPFRFLNDRLPSGKAGQPYKATLHVENNITNVKLVCNPTGGDDRNISFTDPNFSGDINGTLTDTNYWSCKATETFPSGSLGRIITKLYVITIDHN